MTFSKDQTLLTPTRRLLIKQSLALTGIGLVPGLFAADANAAATPKRGGTLTVGTPAEVGSLSPLKAPFTVTHLSYLPALHDPLLYVDDKLNLAPWLALAVEPNATVTEYVIKLRPGIVFHDGNPHDAKAVKNSLDATIASPFQSGVFGTMVASVDVVDDLTVSVKLKKPWAWFPHFLTQPSGAGVIYAPSQLQSVDLGASHPVGTGPYMFEEWVSGDHLTVVRNPNYWRKDRPYFDKVIFKPIADDLSRENSLLAGSIDFMQTSSTRSISRLQSDSSISYLNDLNLNIVQKDLFYYLINTAKPPYDDVRIRRILATATDVKKITKIIYGGLTPPVTSYFGAESPFHIDTPYPAYDLETAKNLIAEYEKEKGKIPPITISATPVDNQSAQLIQAMWSQAGLTVKIKTVDATALINDQSLGNFEVSPYRQNGSRVPDGDYTTLNTPAPLGKPTSNRSRINDPELQGYLNTMRSSPVSQERIDAFKKLQTRLNELVPYLWLTYSVWSRAAKSNIHGFNEVPLPDGGVSLAGTGGFINVGEMWSE